MEQGWNTLHWKGREKLVEQGWALIWGLQITYLSGLCFWRNLCFATASTPGVCWGHMDTCFGLSHIHFVFYFSQNSIHIFLVESSLSYSQAKWAGIVGLGSGMWPRPYQSVNPIPSGCTDWFRDGQITQIEPIRLSLKTLLCISRWNNISFHLVADTADHGTESADIPLA